MELANILRFVLKYVGGVVVCVFLTNKIHHVPEHK